jgi:hypothetical protein
MISNFDLCHHPKVFRFQQFFFTHIASNSLVVNFQNQFSSSTQQFPSLTFTFQYISGKFVIATIFSLKASEISSSEQVDGTQTPQLISLDFGTKKTI